MLSLKLSNIALRKKLISSYLSYPNPITWRFLLIIVPLLFQAIKNQTPLKSPLKSWLFQASIRNCLNCVHHCEDHSILDFKSAVQYMKHFIYHFTFIPPGLIITHKWPAPNVSGFIAQLVRASHRHCKVTGSNPVEVMTFSGFYTQLLKLGS